MAREHTQVLIPGLAGPRSPLGRIIGSMTWNIDDGESTLVEVESALLRFRGQNAGVRVVRTDGKVVTEWALFFHSLPTGYIRVSAKQLEIDAAVQGLERWGRHQAAQSALELWVFFFHWFCSELALGDVDTMRPDGKSGKQARAAKRARCSGSLPKGTRLARWKATWRYVRPHVERGITDPRTLLGRLAAETSTAHLADWSEETMRKIVKAGVDGKLD